MNPPAKVMLLVLVAACGCAWSFLQYSRAQEELAFESRRLQACQRLANRIAPLAAKSQQLIDDSFQPDDLISLLESEAIRLSGRISNPPGPRRSEETGYRIEHLELPGFQVTLGQLAEVLGKLDTVSSGLRVSALTLIAAADEQRTEDGPELWTASGLKFAYLTTLADGEN